MHRIDLDYQVTGLIDRYGNAFRYRARVASAIRTPASGPMTCSLPALARLPPGPPAGLAWGTTLCPAWQTLGPHVEKGLRCPGWPPDRGVPLRTLQRWPGVARAPWRGWLAPVRVVGPAKRGARRVA